MSVNTGARDRRTTLQCLRAIKEIDLSRAKMCRYSLFAALLGVPVFSGPAFSPPQHLVLHFQLPHRIVSDGLLY